MYTFNPSIGKAEAGSSLWVHSHPVLYIKFQAIQSYIAKPCLKTTIIINFNYKKIAKQSLEVITFTFYKEAITCPFPQVLFFHKVK